MKKPPPVEMVPLKALKPYKNNARTHSEAQIEQLCASLQEFGWTNPILIDGKKGVIAGHARLQAAEKLGYEAVPCIKLAHLTPAQRRAYIIADNKLALNAGWDEPLLGMELLELDGMGFDCALTGFSGDELEGLFARAQSAGGGLTDPDAVPEVQDAVVSSVGDVWLCGRHRLRCGDSTKAEDVEALLAGVEPHLMVTDPPYGVNYQPDWRNQNKSLLYKTKNTRYIEGDDEARWDDAHALFPGEVAYVWHGALHSTEVAQALMAQGFEIRAEIVWIKEAITIGRGHYSFQHESCWYAVRKAAKAHWQGPKNASSVWKINRVDEHPRSGHAAQKPVECMRRPIVNNSNPGQAVYDPFLGSGTTMIAAEKEARTCYGMEIAPQYVDVCVRRWQDFVGEQATLEDDGRTFDEIADERYVAGRGADERGGGLRSGGAGADPGVSVVRAESQPVG